MTWSKRSGTAVIKERRLLREPPLLLCDTGHKHRELNE
jgi:hypothetical protein